MALDWNEIIITNDDEVVNGKVRDRMILVTGEKGEDGVDGRGIVSIRRSHRSGNDYYFTVEYTDGTKSVFEIDLPEGGGSSDINTLAFAKDFDPSRHYSAGKYVWFENMLYRFVFEHNAGNEWDESIVEEISVTDELMKDVPFDGEVYGRYMGGWKKINIDEKQPLTLYVDCLNGSDSNDGGIEHPFATLQKAFSEMEDNTGSIHIVRTGTFTGNDITIAENVTVYLEDHVTVDFNIYISGRVHVTFISNSTFGKTINFTTGHSLEISYADVNFNYVNLNTSSAIEITNGYLFSDSTYTMYTTSTSEGSNNRGLTIVDNSKVYFENLDLTCRMGYWIDEGSVLAYGNLTKVTQVSDVVRAGSRVHHGNFIDIGDAPSDDKTYGRNNGNWTEISTDNATWGNITGNLSSQTDLIQYIDDEVNNPYYYVVNGSTGSDSNDGKTAEHPLATIQAAINKIPDNKTGRIVIVEGTYNELLTINKKNITFACGNTTVTLPASGTTHSITNSIVKIEKNGNGAKTFTFTGYLQITNSVLISDIDVTVDDQTLSNPVISLVDVTASKMIVRYCTLISKNATIFLNAKDGSNVYLGYYTATDMSGASQSNFTAITASKGSIVSYMQLNGLQTKSEVTGGKIFPETINYYTKSETDMKLALKASVADLNTKAPINSPELTGTPTAPTATEGTKTTQIATTAFVDRAIEDFSVVVSGEEVVDSGAEVEITSVDNGISVMWTPEYPPYNTRASQEQRWWTGGKINSFAVYLNPTYSELPPSITDVADWSRKYVSTSDCVLEWNLDEPICGGILNPLTGQLKITWGYIDSYNGETLTGKWRSSLEAYVEGTSPSIGAKVAYELAIPIITSATRNDIDSDFTEITPEMVGDKLASQVFFSTGNDLAIGVTTIYDQQTEMKIKDYIDSQDATKQDVLTFDDVPTANSTNPVKSGGVKTALDTKQDTLTFDSVPTENSDNPVTSGGIKTALDGKSDPVTKSASGSMVTLTDATDAPVNDMVVTIEPVQTGSGDPSPSNVRAISGWTACNVTSTGKNLLPNKKHQSATTRAVIGQDVNYTSRNLFLPVGTYTISVTATTTGDIYYRGPDDNNNHKLSSGLTATLTVTKAGTFCFWVYNADGISIDDITSFQLELGSSVTTYEAYQGTTYSVSFGSAGTVYGGTLDVSTGVLTVDWAFAEFDGSSDENWLLSSWPSQTNTKVYYCNNEIIPTNTLPLACNLLPPKSYNALRNNDEIGIGFSGSSSNMKSTVRCPASFATVSDWKTYLASNHLQFVYELATPQTYQLTPAEVRILSGLCQVWADTGDVTLKYRADTKRYIDNDVSELQTADTDTRGMITESSETSMVATKDYYAGELIIVNNKLLRATANIATAGAITIGTNAEYIDLSAILKDLEDRVTELEQ